MNFKLTDFCIEDAEQLCLHAVDQKLCNNEEYWRKWSNTNLSAGPGVTFWADDTRLFSMGISLMDCGCGRIGAIWGIFSKDIIRYKKSVFRMIQMLLSVWAKHLGYKWIWAESRKGFPESQRLLEHFGFERSEKETTEDYYYYLRNPVWV